MTRLFSPAWPRNSAPIRAAVGEHLAGARSILEVASGPGQHAFDHAAILDATVTPTDKDASALASIDAWRMMQGDERVQASICVDVSDSSTWPNGPFDALIAINFLHMVPLPVCGHLFELAAHVLHKNGRVAVYDCFTFEGAHVSQSNAHFHERLQAVGGAVHAIEEMDDQAIRSGFQRHGVWHLPANNQFVVWQTHR